MIWSHVVCKTLTGECIDGTMIRIMQDLIRHYKVNGAVLMPLSHFEFRGEQSEVHEAIFGENLSTIYIAVNGFFKCLTQEKLSAFWCSDLSIGAQYDVVCR